MVELFQIFGWKLCLKKDLVGTEYSKVRTIKLWNRKTTFRLDLLLEIAL